jgi:hypothetical protein
MIKPAPGKPSDSPADRSDPSEPTGSDLGDVIGRRLKTLFDDVAAEPIPDRLRQLVEELERKSGKTK